MSWYSTFYFQTFEKMWYDSHLPIFFWHRNGNLTYFNFSSHEKILKFDIFRDVIKNLSFSHICLCQVSPTALLPSISLISPVTRGGHMIGVWRKMYRFEFFPLICDKLTEEFHAFLREFLVIFEIFTQLFTKYCANFLRISINF